MTEDKNKEIEKLTEKIKELEKTLEYERKEKDKIAEEKDKIVKKFEKVKKEFEEFKAKHSVAVTNLRRALNIKANSRNVSKPLGAPKGHVAYSRHVHERIDHVKALIPKECSSCNCALTGKTIEIRHRFVTRLKLIWRAETTRYDIHRKRCKKCKKIVEKEVPNVLPHCQFDLNIMLLIMYLKLGLRLSCTRVCEYFLTLHDLHMSPATITHTLKLLASEFGDYYAHLEKIVKLARVKHTDSTSWRIKGKNYFLWVFIAYGVVLYKIRRRNNAKVPLAVFGTKQKGNTLVIDRHSALRTLAKKAGFILQFCWSHITDDSKKLAENFGIEACFVHRKLKEIYAIAKSRDHKGTPEQVEQLKGEIFQLTLRHYKHSTVRRFVNNLYYRDIESLFIFVTDPDVDPTNNISERELRELVIQRTITHGSGSQRGANAMAMLISVIQTLKLNRRNILHGLRHIINNRSGY
jgi:transposase